MSKRSKTRIGLKYAIGGKCRISLDDALYRIVRCIYDTTFYKCFHEWSFEEIVHESTIHIEKANGSDNYDYTIYCYIDTDSYMGDHAIKWEKGAYRCKILNGLCMYVPSKEFKIFYDECIDSQIRTLKDGVFTSPPVYDFILSLFKDVIYEDMESEETKTKYNAIVDAVKEVLCGKEKEVVIEGDDDFPWEDPFFH